MKTLLGMPASTILQQKSPKAKMASHILHVINFFLNYPLHRVQVYIVPAIPDIDLAGERRENWRGG